MDALLLSFGVVFVAELGDKSQLVVLAFAARYRIVPVMIGISAASAVMLGASVLVGAVVGDALPTDAANVLSGLAFLGFAGWTLRAGGHGAADATPVERGTGSAVLTVAVAFVLAELGDKTMLATVTLATTRGLWGTWAGATLGMVAANALAVAGGRALGARLSDRALQLGSAGLFVVFGVLLLLEGLTG